VTLLCVRILSMCLSERTAGSESDLCVDRVEANSSCKVDRSEHSAAVERDCHVVQKLFLVHACESGRAFKQSTIQYLIMFSTNNLSWFTLHFII
jgi:hypothetical protein